MKNHRSDAVVSRYFFLLLLQLLLRFRKLSVFLAILAVLLGVIGLIGSIVPVLPGPPVSWLGLLLISFTRFAEMSVWFLLLWFALTVIVTIADNFLPAIMAKRYGGSRAAVIGTIGGMVVGMFFAPWGMIVGPFAGAFAGEFIGNRSQGHVALRVATGAFIAFIGGVGLKMVSSGMMLYYIVRELVV